jgi:hypothetical protein
LSLFLLIDKNLLVISDEAYVRIGAPMTGAIISAGIVIGKKYLRRRNRFNNRIFNDKINIDIRSPTYVPLNKPNISFGARKILFLRKKILSILASTDGVFVFMNEAVFFIERLTLSSFLVYSLVETFSIATKGVIVLRFIVILQDSIKYSFKNKLNLLKIAANSLWWIVYNKNRTLTVQLAFIGVSLLTTVILNKVPKLRTALLICILIPYFNLCSQLEVVDINIALKAHTRGTFGLPLIERTIPHLKPTAEHFENPKIKMSLQDKIKEDEFVLSLPIQTELTKSISKDINIETSKIIKSSILGEEETVVIKREGVQKGKASKTNSTSKLKRRRMNTLPNLNKTDDNITSLTTENELKNLPNSSKIKEEKVK